MTGGVDDSEVSSGCAATGGGAPGSFAFLTLAAVAAIRRRRTR